MRQDFSNRLLNHISGRRLLLGIVFLLSSSNFSMAQDAAKNEKPARTISFSGYEWQVKSSRHSKSGTMGPGNNHFSDSDKNVWVDKNGWLHLKITRWNDNWYCAEVTLLKPLGYKRYIFHVAGRVDHFHPNVVGGLFTYLDGSDHVEETDIEFSKWGDEKMMNNTHYTIQPSEKQGNMVSFKLDLSGDASTHIIDWKPGEIDFASYHGHYLHTPDSAFIIKKWSYSGTDVPSAPNGKIHINLWLFRRDVLDQEDHVEAEMIIKKFLAL